jgi:anti-anti-sigma factor
MHFDSMDITIEGRSGAIWLTLTGAFRKDQIPHMREKFEVLLEDQNRSFVVDLENITSIDDSVVQMFIHLLNTIKGKGGDIKLIFKNEIVSRSFASYNNIFPVYPDAAALSSGGFLNAIRLRSRLLSKKTGIRISRPVAIFLLIVLCGWFISLLYIIRIQSRYLTKQQVEVHSLRQYNQQTKIEIDALRERIKPLEQLGILSNSKDVKKDETRK